MLTLVIIKESCSFADYNTFSSTEVEDAKSRKKTLMSPGQTRRVSGLKKDGKRNHDMGPILYKVVDDDTVNSIVERNIIN